MSNLFQKARLYYFTIKYLKWRQIHYQIKYRVRQKWRSISNFQYDNNLNPKNFELITFGTSIDNYNTYFGELKFKFLNLNRDFENKINWDYPNFGKLWTYNLNYFEYLNQSNSYIYTTEYNKILDDFILQLPNLKNANEPFPTSLRIINWIKYFIKNNLVDEVKNNVLYSQCFILKDNIEYHLAGNHLLENAFALTISGIYFQEKIFFDIGKKILLEELDEQILDDGAHFELSPMYHCLMLYRLLDTINIFESNRNLINNTLKNQDDFLVYLKSKAGVMCGFLTSIIYNDGSYPHFNDSTDGIAPNAKELLEYAKRLNIRSNLIKLSESGFRRINNEIFDLIIKAGNIGANYIPGHAHADSLNFVCKIHEIPFIVDTGISTYEKNEIRQLERSTISHNTVTIANINSSEVWGGFRVGQRANSIIESETHECIKASHDGYLEKHYREIKLEKDKLIILDKLISKDTKAIIHFHPNISFELKEFDILFSNNYMIKFENASSLRIESYAFALGYNNTLPSKKLIIEFKDFLITTISKVEDIIFN